MKIVLAGELDRVYANARARASGDAANPANDNADGAQFEEDRLLFNRAGTLMALGETVVAIPDWYPLDDEDEKGRTDDRVDPSFAPGMSLTKRAWAALYDDTAGLVQAVDFLGSYSERSQAILEEIDMSDAWVEDDSPRSLQRAIIGAAHAYLTELLLQAFLAWQAGAVLVVGEADCHLLADIAEFLVEGGRARPFPFPTCAPPCDRTWHSPREEYRTSGSRNSLTSRQGGRIPVSGLTHIACKRSSRPRR